MATDDLVRQLLMEIAMGSGKKLNICLSLATLASVVALVAVSAAQYQAWTKEKAKEHAYLEKIQYQLEMIDVCASAVLEMHEQSDYTKGGGTLEENLESLCSVLYKFFTRVAECRAYLDSDIPETQEMALAAVVMSDGKIEIVGDFIGCLGSYRAEILTPPSGVVIWDGEEERRYSGSFSADGALSPGEVKFLAELKADLADVSRAIGDGERKSMRDFNEAYKAVTLKWRARIGEWSPFNYLLEDDGGAA
jgi:hypothetical protein